MNIERTLACSPGRSHEQMVRDDVSSLVFRHVCVTAGTAGRLLVWQPPAGDAVGDARMARNVSKVQTRSAAGDAYRVLVVELADYPATTRADVDRQMAKIKAKLMKQGYTVNGETNACQDARVWHVYVIELADGAK